MASTFLAEGPAPGKRVVVKLLPWSGLRGASSETARALFEGEMQRLAAALHDHGAKSDLMESRAAFAEKRKPNFKGWNDPADRYRLPGAKKR